MDQCVRDLNPQPSHLYQKLLGAAARDLLDKSLHLPVWNAITSAMGRVTAVTDFHEWQTDSLAAASAANKMIDGDDDTGRASGSTVRSATTYRLQQYGSWRFAPRQHREEGGPGHGNALPQAPMPELKRNIEAMVPVYHRCVAATTFCCRSSPVAWACGVPRLLHDGAGATAAWTSGAPGGDHGGHESRDASPGRCWYRCTEHLRIHVGPVLPENAGCVSAHKVLFCAWLRRCAEPAWR